MEPKANTIIYLPQRYVREDKDTVIFSGVFLRSEGQTKEQEGYIKFHIENKTRSQDAWKCTRVN